MPFFLAAYPSITGTWACRWYMPGYSLVSARSLGGVDSRGSSIGPSDLVFRSNAGRLRQTWTVEHWSGKAAYVAAGVLGRRKAVTEGGVEAVERRMYHLEIG